ncbi:SatD family protein [Lutibacter sp. B1]|uniref:SatD family protein n=1 Tax=Lutibacter sp. B1 TaxID=2725996 RepID=UPI00145692C1|nr:SatD family protein [Lutibacter sp. B1]NLP56841.1 transcriptional regulator [Lutibacter sp. B1]
MKAIITGDIINSRSEDVTLWMPTLKEQLNAIGTTPKHWEIYRGDSFQLQVPPQKALVTAFKIKAAVKQFKQLDVRMAIGIGKVTYQAKKITESNGEAFINSGGCFEDLKKQTLAIKSPWQEFDTAINLMLEIMGITINSWSQNSALLIKEILENPNSTQKELAQLLHKSQSNISAGLKRAGYDEIQKIIHYYTNQINALC